MELEDAIYNKEVMPSMRAMMTAGPAADRDNTCIYNCGYVPIEGSGDLADLMYILMSGTGVGFSVERQYISQLPEVPNIIVPDDDPDYHVPDSKGGWCNSYHLLLDDLFAGRVPSFDFSAIRPEGSRLHTMGGRASGPQPLIDLINFTTNIFMNARGRKLNSAEVHELCCKIAQIVVVGGVRRSALISLSNLSDPRMRDIKKGDLTHSEHLYLSNNSVCYTEKPDLSIFMQEMSSLYESKSGERGVYNRVAAQNIATETGRRDPEWDFGTNPCSEIILRPRQFCNLTEAVVRPDDTLIDLKRKVRLATILGTLQSNFTDFPFLDERWKTNTEEERLLGVSLTGIMDHPILSGDDCLPDWLEKLKEVAIETNMEWASRLGIPQSKAITCVKPSGTVSQLVDSASGIHDRYAPYYIRRVRSDKKDPLTSVLIDIGVPYEDDVTNPSTVVFSFPMKAPTTSKYTGAMEKLKLWLIYQNHWCEHKPSVTINYTDDEFLQLIAVLYAEFDNISGISLLPKDDHVYSQAVYEEITEEEYEEMLQFMPSEDHDLQELLTKYEKEDHTDNVKELACVAGVCDI